MAQRNDTTNEYLAQLIHELKKASSTSKAAIWGRVAEDLDKASRNRREVNISRINRCTAADEIVIVPGKVLGSGHVDHSITIAAFRFSDGAKARIIEAKGKAITIPELMKQHPQGKNVRIIG